MARSSRRNFIAGWAAVIALVVTSSHHVAQGADEVRTRMLRHSPSQQRWQLHSHPPSVAIAFTTPSNGSMVDGPDVRLHYKLYRIALGDDRSDGSTRREMLTASEAKHLSKSTTMCFKLHGFDDKPQICAPLALTTVIIKDALPAKWHQVTASIKNTATGQVLKGSEDFVSVFVSLQGYGMLDMCGKSACLDTTELRSAYFNHVYRHAKWEDIGVATTKATQPSSTIAVRSALAEVISSYGITSMLDAPCGDVSWIPLVSGIESVDYTGADIAERAVMDNRIKLAGEFGKLHGTDIGEEIAAVLATGGGLQEPVFVQEDLVDRLPPSPDGNPFDLVFVRDFMVHLPARHNLRVLQNIQASGARFLMASTYVSADENKASETFVPIMGHNINLSLPPYCLPEPIALFEDNSSDRPDGRMGLWELNPSVPLTLSGDCSAISRSA